MTTENIEQKVRKVYYELVYSVDTSFTVELDNIPVECEDEEEFIFEAQGGSYDDIGVIEIKTDDPDGDSEDVDVDPSGGEVELEHEYTRVVAMNRITEYEMDGEGNRTPRKFESIFS
jgi:hypothetical protein